MLIESEPTEPVPVQAELSSSSDLSKFAFANYGSVETVCGREALGFFSIDGFQGLQSKWFFVQSGQVAQFDIMFACEESDLVDIYVTLEQWRPLTTSYQVVKSTKYYATSYGPGWHRITVALESTTSVLNWEVTGATEDTFWALSNVYIGNTCEMGCSGHGYCQSSGVCACDPGYFAENSTCIPVVPAPTTFTTRFDGSDSLNLFASSIGASIETCFSEQDNQGLILSGPNRDLQTPDLDTRGVFEVTFSTDRPSSPCEFFSTSSSNFFQLFYSTNGGLHWSSLGSYSAPNNYASATLPQEARTSSTRFMWINSHTSSISQVTSDAVASLMLTLVHRCLIISG